MSLDFIGTFEKFSPAVWLLFSIAVNLALYLFSIALYLVIDSSSTKEKIQTLDFPILKADMWQSLLTVFLNAVVMLVAVYLWKNNWIVLEESTTVAAVILEIAGITLVMDFLMYVFHYLAHRPFIYRLLHYKHHEHVSTNCLSLFVLHPFEALGFGIMMIGVFMSYDFSLVSISIYLLINLVWGTVGHLNRAFSTRWTDTLFLGTAMFHNQHHVNEDYNFGFYSTIWDRLFGTYKQ